MSPSVRQFYHLLSKGPSKKLLFPEWTPTRICSLFGTLQELPGSAIYESSSKHVQVVADKNADFQALRRLHTGRSLSADNTKGCPEGPDMEATADDKVKNNIDGNIPQHDLTELDKEASVFTIDDNVKYKTDGDGRPFPQAARNPISWLSFFLLLVTGAGLIFYYYLEKERRIEALRQAGAEKPAIGGPFKLISHEGKEVTDEQLKGNWTMLYFGFTHCPDICPDELQKMVDAVDLIEKQANVQVTPVFISVDPERDSVEQMREYVKEFHPRLIGLTGSLEDIKQVARAYRVYYMKTHEEGADYLVDHSIITILMDPNMEFVKFFGKTNNVNTRADAIIAEIRGHKT